MMITIAYDDYNCIFGIKLKGISLSFILGVMQWNQNVLSIIFSKKTWSLPKTAFLNIHNFGTYFHPLKKHCFETVYWYECETKACKISTQSYDSISWIDVQEVLFFHATIVTFFERQNVTLLTVINHDFSLFF